MTRTKFNMARFNADNLIGKIGEKAFRLHKEQVTQLFIYNTAKDAPQPHFDAIEYDTVLKRFITHEIKTDRFQSNNVSVQIWSSSKAETNTGLLGWEHSCNSGIYSTLADIYATYNVADHAFYFAESSELRRYIEKNPNLRKTIANRNKPEQTGIVLIPKTKWNEFGWIEECA